jgi:hypothetical protein
MKGCGTARRHVVPHKHSPSESDARTTMADRNAKGEIASGAGEGESREASRGFSPGVKSLRLGVDSRSFGGSRCIIMQRVLITRCGGGWGGRAPPVAVDSLGSRRRVNNAARGDAPAVASNNGSLRRSPSPPSSPSSPSSSSSSPSSSSVHHARPLPCHHIAAW